MKSPLWIRMMEKVARVLNFASKIPKKKLQKYRISEGKLTMQDEVYLSSEFRMQRGTIHDGFKWILYDSYGEEIDRDPSRHELADRNGIHLKSNSILVTSDTLKKIESSFS